MLSRNKNDNLVCYRAERSADGKRLTGVKVFWLDADPTYVAAKKAKGVNDPCEELSFLEKQLGVFHVTTHARGKTGTEMVVTFQQMQKFPCVLTLQSDGRLTFRGTFGSQSILVARLHANEHCGPHMWSTPSVKEIIVFGWKGGAGAKFTPVRLAIPNAKA